ncbi:MAG: hypothetical protein JWQ55_2088 [Rhodopila sp.]|jgi:hypothetical protein|nr:hypothetical protein [Rhodopila sp.]
MNYAGIIRSFVVECERTKLAHDLFRAMFDQGDRQQKLFQSTAPKMFSDLNGIMIEHFYLQVTKLTDPPKPSESTTTSQRTISLSASHGLTT